MQQGSCRGWEKTASECEQERDGHTHTHEMTQDFIKGMGTVGMCHIRWLVMTLVAGAELLKASVDTAAGCGI